jgi:hypothetical protein
MHKANIYSQQNQIKQVREDLTQKSSLESAQVEDFHVKASVVIYSWETACN